MNRLSTDEIKELVRLLKKVGQLYTITDAATVAAFVILEAKRNGRPIGE